MSNTPLPLSSQQQQQLAQCWHLFSSNRIMDAKNQLSTLLSGNEQQKELLDLAFKIELKCQNFSKAEEFYQLLVPLIEQPKQQQLLLISLLEAKEDHFGLLLQLDAYLNRYGEQAEMRFKHGLVAMAAGKILVAEQSFLACLKAKDQLTNLLLNLGHVYKAKGESAKAAQYYRDYIAVIPAQCGVGYWSLADLKDFKFTETDSKDLEKLVNNDSVNLGNKALLSFALARAYEQKKSFDLAFKTMSKANQVFEQHRPFKGDLFNSMINAMIAGVNKKPQALQQAVDFTPIFIVGMPRSGTTLVEQILASHSQVGATDELQYIERIGLELEKSGGYVPQLNKLTDTQRQAFADSYIQQVQQYFDGEQAIVIDKNPNNFLHIGLIKTLFPQAKIINVVRNPLDNALSVFKQYFSRGHEYSYSLQGISYYWQGYLALMQHWKKLFASDIYHLSYEALTQNSESEIRKLLAYCQLDFEPDCLTFYKSNRVVLTPSVSQVKQPINQRSVNSWQQYEQNIAAAMPTFKQIVAKAQALID